MIVKLGGIKTEKDIYQIKGKGFHFSIISIPFSDKAEGLISLLNNFFPDTKIALICEELKTLSAIRKINPDYIQLKKELYFELKESTTNLPESLIIFGIEVDPDESPNWILSEFQNEIKSDLIFEIDIFPDMENPYDYLVNEAQKYPTEFQIQDIDWMAKRYPVFMNINIDETNMSKLLKKVNRIKGICLDVNADYTLDILETF